MSSDTSLLERLAREGGTENLYVELVPGRGRERALAFARAHGLPPVATNAVRFAHPQDHASAVLAAITTNDAVDHRARRGGAQDAWLNRSGHRPTVP
jgi:DNA polymerase III alpha subunit